MAKKNKITYPFVNGVDKDNVKNSKSYHSELEEKLKEINIPQLTDLIDIEDFSEINNQDWNKGMLEYDFDFEPSEEYKERVKALTYGFNSVDNYKANKKGLKDEDNPHSGNVKYFDKVKEKSKIRNAEVYSDRLAGLKTSKLSDTAKKRQQPKSVFKESATGMYVIDFSNQQFKTTSQLFESLPEKFLTNEGCFKVIDGNNTEFVLETKINSLLNKREVNILSKYNKEVANEALLRMKSLFKFNPASYKKVKAMNEDEMANKLVQTIKESINYDEKYI